jgi:hypothetical protein
VHVLILELRNDLLDLLNQQGLVGSSTESIASILYFLFQLVQHFFVIEAFEQLFKRLQPILHEW